MKIKHMILGLFFASLIAAGCGVFSNKSIKTIAAVSYPDTRFAVISDLHFYDKSLGTKGAAFQKYIDNDRKLLVLSDEIIGTAMKRIALEPVDFVLVAGDLTKDGEVICHKGVAKHLQTLREAGKKVFVVPGNHDINNPESVRYDGDTTIPEPGVKADDFEKIYQEFGYKDAIARDPSSLSYVAQPAPGLLLLALDSNRYKENRPDHHPIVGGAFSEQTLAWIKDQLMAAQKENKAVIVLQHHGIMEHYPANEKFYDSYLINEYEEVASLFARFGVRLVFTGHFHAQDVTQKDVKLKNRKSSHRIYDIETGSMVTSPCPYRVVDIAKDSKGVSHASISSRFIKSIPSIPASEGEGFESHATDFVFEGTRRLANKTLSKYWVAKDQQDLINSQVAAAYTAHLVGDEKKPAKTLETKGFGIWLRVVAWLQEDLIDGWWTDLPPVDNNLTIELSTGKS